MRNVFIFFIFICPFIFCIKTLSAPLSGSVYKEKCLDENSSRIIDSISGSPVGNAGVSIPSKGLSTVTDSNGRFNLETNAKPPFILSVEAEGYKPFSMTINESINKPFVLSITKQSPNDIIIDSNLHHLGDNNFSPNSANAYDFLTQSSGASFTKRFFVGSTKPNSKPYLIIGSIIGIDTDVARMLRQNNITAAASSPVQIYLNSQKIGGIKINGDRQELPFSPSFLRINGQNEITVETGRNMYQTKYTDYDDIEFMHLMIELK